MNPCFLFSSMLCGLMFNNPNLGACSASPSVKVQNEGITSTNLNAESTTTCNRTDSSEENTEHPNNVYRFVVSFYSIGAGIDNTTKEEFDAFLKTRYPNINYEEIQWGKEGEVDYCLELKELSAKQQRKLIKAATQLLKKSDKVNIYENHECIHKR